MEFGVLSPMFGMAMVNSLSEVIRIQQQAAEQARAQLDIQPRAEDMQVPAPAEQVQRPCETQRPM